MKRILLSLLLATGLGAQTTPVNNLVVQNGGTALSGLVKANGTSACTAAVAGTDYAPSAGDSSITTLGTVTIGTWSATVIAANRGGTGISSYTIGDLLYASSSSALSKLSAGTSGLVLTSNGPGTAPSWQTSGTGSVTSFSSGALTPLFTTSVATATTTPALSFTLSSSGANTVFGNDTGSTAAPHFDALSSFLDNAFGSAQGDTLYRGSSGWTALSPGTSGQFLQTLGSSANPQWATPAGAGNVSTSGAITTGQTAQWNGSTSLVSVANTGTGSYVLATSPTITTPSITGLVAFPAGTDQTFVPNASVSGFNVGSVSSDPASPVNGDLWYNSTANALNARINGATVALGAGGGGGVTSFSAGNLSPLFTTAVATATTTPALSFTLSTAAADTILGNNTGSTAAPTYSTVSSFLDTFSATQGSVLYRGPSVWTALAPGTSGQVFQSNGAAANPSWITPSGSSSANPSATIGLTVVNGTASTFMTSDSAPPLSQSIAPTWTGLHIWSRTLSSSSGTDFAGLKVTPTYNQTSTAGGVDIFSNRTQTAVGSGSQFLLEQQVGGSDKFTVDNSGQVVANGYTHKFGQQTSGSTTGNFILASQTSASFGPHIDFNVNTTRVAFISGGYPDNTTDLVLRADGTSSNGIVRLDCQSDTSKAVVNTSGLRVAQGSNDAGTTNANVGGTIFDHFSTVGNSGSTETTLYTDTTAANMFSANGQAISAHYGLTIASSATATREIIVYFAGTAIYDSGADSFASAGTFTVSVLIMRDTSTSVRYMVTPAASSGTSLVTTEPAVGTLTGLTLSGTNILKITGTSAGTGSATNDIQAILGQVLYQPAF